MERKVFLWHPLDLRITINRDVNFGYNQFPDGALHRSEQLEVNAN